MILGFVFRGLDLLKGYVELSGLGKYGIGAVVGRFVGICVNVV